ncbi:MAG: cellulase family glycosylhydrolase [Sedimentisphaerales bacterium]|nr:cellulase family glycosylhydrolase [Sedimentisphaerales bacterium]
MLFCRNLRPILIAMILSGCSFEEIGQAKETPGFLQRRGTELVLDGRAVRMVSVNKYDLFQQFVLEGMVPMPPGQHDKAIEALDELASHGFKIIRINCSPYWAGTWRQAWFDDDPAEQSRKREQFLQRLDDMIQACAQRDIRIIATLSWYAGNLADLGHHDLHEGITNPQSPARRRLEEYIRAVVLRYKDSPAIAMWEIGNEWNLEADLQFPQGVLKAVPASMAPPPVVRDGRNNFTSDELARCVGQIAALIKSLDSSHLVTTGHSSPRPSAMHLLRAARAGKSKDWTQDNEAELEEYLRLSHPDPVDVIGIHFYGEAMSALGKTKGDVSNIAIYKRIADRIGKPLLIGEIGLHEEIGDDYSTPEAIRLVQKQLAAVSVARVPITLYWTFRDDSGRIDPVTGPYQLRFDRTDTALELMQSAN